MVAAPGARCRRGRVPDPGHGADRPRAGRSRPVPAAGRPGGGRVERAVLLLDTADVLLHRSSDVVTLVQLLSRLPGLGIPAVVASRTAEAALLEQEYHGGLDSLLDKHVLGAYSDEEWQEAVDAYAAVYYRRPGDPPPRLGGVTPVEHLPRRGRVRDEIAAAVARGLPMREVVVHPLSLRMLFEVYAPGSPAPEVDVSDLHDLLWQARVAEDKRAHADPGARAASPAAARDLSLVAGELGLAMIREGTFSIAGDTAVRLISARLRVSGEDAGADLAELTRRDVIRLRDSDGGTFLWHQTMAEHAAGRAIAAYGAAGLDCSPGASSPAPTTCCWLRWPGAPSSGTPPVCWARLTARASS